MIYLIIRLADKKDIEKIEDLLSQVLAVHHNGREDLFKAGGVKYTPPELEKILKDPQRPIFVADDNGVVGYAFCIFIKHENDNILTDVKTLYIDDLCVDASQRKKGVGRKLYEYVLDFAKESGCYNVTLNVWSCNEGALEFYKSLGMIPQKICMEKILPPS